MESDENAPPPKSEQPTQSGLFSSFGFLTRVLSPVVKEQQPTASDSPVTSRPILKDVNSASPKLKGFMNVGQGAQGDVPDNAVQLSSPGNNSQPDHCQPTEVKETDSDCILSFPLPSQTVNASSLNDTLVDASFLENFDKALNFSECASPEDFSTTLNSVNQSDASLTELKLLEELEEPFYPASSKSLENSKTQYFQSDEANYGLNDTVVEVIDTSHTSNVSAVPPVESSDDSKTKSNKKLPVKEDALTGALNPSSEHLDESIQPRGDQDISPVSVISESENSQISKSSDVDGADFNDSFYSLDQSEVSATDLKLLEKLETTVLSQSNLALEVSKNTYSQSDTAIDCLDETVVEVVDNCHTSNVSAVPPVEVSDNSRSDLSHKFLEKDASLDVSSLLSENQDVSVKSSCGQDNIFDSVISETENSQFFKPTDLNGQDTKEADLSDATISEGQVEKGGEVLDTLSLSKTEGDEFQSRSSEKETLNGSELTEERESADVRVCGVQAEEGGDILSTLSLGTTDSDEPQLRSTEIETVNCASAEEEESGCLVRDPEFESHQGSESSALVGSSSFEDTPLPVKVPRSFEEILAEQLAAEEHASKLSESDANPCNAAPLSFDEAPLPVKIPQSFEEILEQQLAAEDQKSAPSKAQPEPEEHVSVDKINPEAVLDANHVLEEVNDPSSQEIESTSPLKEDTVNTSTCVEEIKNYPDQEPCTDTVSVLDEVPIPIKAPRTFEEILAAELAAQSDPEQAVPSFSSAPRKLEESLAEIISSETSPLESECEPELVCETVSAELELEAKGDLDYLIEKCKQQEQDLEQGDTDFNCVAAEASRLSLSLSDSHKGNNNLSQDSENSDCANQTVIMVDKETSGCVDSFAMKSEVGISPLQTDSEESCPPAPAINLHGEEFISGDLFKDPSAFDFLSLHGGSRTARDLRKESLYVKFDPLVGSSFSDSFSIMHPENSSDSQAVSTGGMDRHQTTESQLSASEKLLSFSPSASSKPPQDNASVASSTTPKKGNLVKSTPAHVMLNETLESIEARGTPIKQEDLIKKLQEHQSVLEEQDKAYQERISVLEQRLQEMELGRVDSVEEVKEQLKDKDKQLQEKVKSLSELNVIMKEYEKTISRLVAEKSQEKTGLEEKITELMKDRDQAQQHLNNMEIAFADIHTKYERLKSVVEAFKKNEETLNNALAEKQENFDKMQHMYDMLKAHAVSKLESANQDLETMKQKHQQENAKMKAIIKKLEIKTKSLEETLEQKVKENQALTAICDELINKVGE